MNFDIAGPFNLQLTPGGLVAASAPARKAFWKMADSEYVDISTARGFYIFALRSPNGTMPWYVGKAASNSFAGECLQPHKIVHYNNSFQGKRYSPQLFFIPKYTAGGKYAAQSKNAQHDIDFLETYLIGLALKRNSELQKKCRQDGIFKKYACPWNYQSGCWQAKYCNNCNKVHTWSLNFSVWLLWARQPKLCVERSTLRQGWVVQHPSIPMPNFAFQPTAYGGG